jgi:hypothetical protein
VTKSIAFTFGRFNPPTTGHEKLLNKTRGANKNYRVYASQSQDPKRNPLNHRNKIAVMKGMFPDHSRKISRDKMTTALDVMVQLYKEKYTDVLMVVGSDRVEEFKSLLDKYNGVKARHGRYKFKSIRIISAGERDPDSDDVTGMSASKMRQAAQDNKFAEFKKGLPKKYKGGRQLFQAIRKSMGVKTMGEWLEESVIDIPRKTYAKNIFDNANSNKPKLKPEVISFIEKRLSQFESVAPIIDYQLIGSILTHRYRADADLDINVWFDAKTEAKHLELRKMAAKVNGKPVPGTKHPVNFFAVITEEYFKKAGDMADATFNIKENKLDRVAKEKPFDISKYVDEFNNDVSKLDIIKGELHRDIIDYKELSELEPDEVVELKVRLSEKLKEIEDSVKELVDVYSVTKDERRTSYEKEMTPEQIRKWGDQRRLPKNVIYKMLEKYYYFDFIHTLDDIIGDDDRLDDNEVKRLMKLVQTKPMNKEIEEKVVFHPLSKKKDKGTKPCDQLLPKDKAPRIEQMMSFDEWVDEENYPTALQKFPMQLDPEEDDGDWVVGDPTKPVEVIKPVDKKKMKKFDAAVDADRKDTDLNDDGLKEVLSFNEWAELEEKPGESNRNMWNRIAGSRIHKKEYKAAAKLYQDMIKKRKLKKGDAIHKAASTYKHVTDRGLQDYLARQ